MPKTYSFTRDPDGDPPNNLLNYGYAVLRAAMSRAVVSSGLHPALGLHHQNQYNPFCLADDLMEPYRPFIDTAVRKAALEESLDDSLTKKLKAALIGALTVDCMMNGERKPLVNAMTVTSRSVATCLQGEADVIQYPSFHAA